MKYPVLTSDASLKILKASTQVFLTFYSAVIWKQASPDSSRPKTLAVFLSACTTLAWGAACSLMFAIVHAMNNFDEDISPIDKRKIRIPIVISLGPVPIRNVTIACACMGLFALYVLSLIHMLYLKQVRDFQIYDADM